ncbi:MAG: hypothetical protein BTN85_2022 [Candidatus Methanohalarchaeum thermophilum]|uniref:Uncharacterized protein n=1 Tax=Methanohalarchaeum thermophilum TaxID=1903181 RepID=A0A1Q6DSR7_METT1|nr:MAG: hypothetical protein BTN85_2022 [Candidatus Methanohalarchaeum thermophilum]
MDLYRRLPGLNYKVIIFIFRVHFTTDIRSEEFDYKSSLFTEEKYESSKYLVLQSKKLLLQGVFEEKRVFAATYKFVSTEMEGEFNDTLVIFDSCHTFTLSNKYKLIQAFL